jgi:ABC-type multidrug transport system fused ATPase/permease subunit
MTQVILPFLTAIALSAIAAFYSVIGLAQIFPGSFWPIVIMGAVLEVAKLVTVSWLYNNWNVTMQAMRYYFVIAIVFLMLITSMGIFGFLSRAHIESNIVVGANSVQLQTIITQEKIARERLDYLLKKAGEDPEKIARSTDRSIQETQLQLKRLAEEKLPLLTKENELAAEIGPIKYIAEALYGKEDPDFIDKAVRVVIVVIIVVFDPLAILLLIAANQSYRNIKKEEKPQEQIKKAIRKKKIDNVSGVSVESFVDDKHQIIPKNKITNLDGGSF